LSQLTACIGTPFYHPAAISLTFLPDIYLVPS
jgi:hypothetical protein